MALNRIIGNGTLLRNTILRGKSEPDFLSVGTNVQSTLTRMIEALARNAVPEHCLADGAHGDAGNAIGQCHHL